MNDHALLQQARDLGIAKIRWCYYWEDDEGHIQDPDYFHVDGTAILWPDSENLPRQFRAAAYKFAETFNGDYSLYELNIATGEIFTCGDCGYTEPEYYESESEPALAGWIETDDENEEESEEEELESST